MREASSILLKSICLIRVYASDHFRAIMLHPAKRDAAQDCSCPYRRIAL
jgi:hypothetical protein